MLKLSRQVDYGKPAPHFALPDIEGNIRALDEFSHAPALLVAFICNHCPFVLHIIDHFAEFARDYAAKGLQVVAISSNEPSDYPEDAFEFMPAFARDHKFTFPYLYDEAQDVALAYGAVCTPDFFLFDAQRKLVYNGQYDGSRPKINRPPVPGLPPLAQGVPVTGADMRAAVEAVLAGQAVPEPHVPSAGCSIKWHSEKSPSWG